MIGKLIASVVAHTFRERPKTINFDGHFFPMADPATDPEAARTFYAAAHILYALYDNNQATNDATYS